MIGTRGNCDAVNTDELVWSSISSTTFPKSSQVYNTLKSLKVAKLKDENFGEACSEDEGKDGDENSVKDAGKVE